MKILVVGGAGFVGSNLAVHFARQGYDVAVMDNLVRRGSEFNLSRLANEGIVFRHGDARCVEDWKGLKADVVLDTAAQPATTAGYGNPRYDITNNTFAVLNTLEFCRDQDAGLVFWSTNKVYSCQAVHDQNIREWDERFDSEWDITEECSVDGADRSIYGTSKIMADLMIQEFADAFQMPAVVNRCSCLAGPWQWGMADQGWVAWWVIAHVLGIPLNYIGFGGKQVRDVLFIDDLCNLVQRQVEMLAPGARVFNVGGGRKLAMSLIECTNYMHEILGVSVPITSVPPRRADFSCYISNISKVSQTYDWYPDVGLRDGLEKIAAWVKKNESMIASLIPPGTATVAPESSIFTRQRWRNGTKCDG